MLESIPYWKSTMHYTALSFITIVNPAILSFTRCQVEVENKNAEAAGEKNATTAR